MVITHVVPKQVVGEDEKEMDWYNQCVYNPQLSVSAYFGHTHLHQLLFLQRNQDKYIQKENNNSNKHRQKDPKNLLKIHTEKMP